MTSDKESTKSNTPKTPSKKKTEVECPEDYMRCSSGNKCIPEQWVCDVWSDCPDNEDEANCPGEIHSNIPCSNLKMWTMINMLGH